MAFLQNSYKKLCSITRILQEMQLFAEDNLICWEQLTMNNDSEHSIYVKILEIGTFCAVSIMLIQYRAGLLISLVKIIP